MHDLTAPGTPSPQRDEWPAIGELAPLEQRSVAEVLDGLGPVTVVAHDPPWATVAPHARPPVRLVLAGSVERTHLDELATAESATKSDVVVGIGGGTAIDTAKHLAWRTGKRLVLAPTVLSVDAAFTREIGVREGGRVRYIGDARPELVVLDTALVRGAPAHLNRAGIGDVLSCHTALWDWRTSTARGADSEHPWRDDLATLAHALLDSLHDAADDIRAVSDDGVAFLADALRHIGAACTAAGHARFEEGSEHFLAYAIEHTTQRAFVHGELIACCVVAMATLQDNSAEWVRDVVRRTGVRATLSHLELDGPTLRQVLAGVRAYASAETLWPSVIDEVELDDTAIERVVDSVRQIR